MKIVSTLNWNEDAPITLELDGGDEEAAQGGQTLELSVPDAVAISEHLREAVLNHAGRETVDTQTVDLGDRHTLHLQVTRPIQ